MKLIEPEPAAHVGESSLGRPQLKETQKAPSPLGAKPQDVIQGAIANCPIAAVMLALAHTRPAKLSSMLGAPQSAKVKSKRRADKTYRFTTDFYYDVTFPGRGKPTRITGLLYFRGGDVLYAATPAGPGWPSFIEKAYAVWKGGGGRGSSGGSYARLDSEDSLRPPPDGGEVIRDLVGKFDMAHITGKQFFTADEKVRALEKKDIPDMAKRAGKRPTIAASRTGKRGHNIIGNHGYAVLGWRKGNLRLRNPHGGNHAVVTISAANFRKEFQAVWQAL